MSAIERCSLLPHTPLKHGLPIPPLSALPHRPGKTAVYGSAGQHQPPLRFEMATRASSPSSAIAKLAHDHDAGPDALFRHAPGHGANPYPEPPWSGQA